MNENMFFVGSLFLSRFINTIPLSAAPLNTTRLSCILMNNQPWTAGTEIVNVNSNNPIFHSFGLKTSKCSGNCNNINDPYPKNMCSWRCKRFTR